MLLWPRSVQARRAGWPSTLIWLLLELLRKFVGAALDPVAGQFAIAHLPNRYAGKLHRAVISRCAEHASIETSEGPTGNNASAANAAEHIVTDQARLPAF